MSKRKPSKPKASDSSPSPPQPAGPPRHLCPVAGCGLDLTVKVERRCAEAPHLESMIRREPVIADAAESNSDARRMLDLISNVLTASSVTVQCANGHWSRFPCGAGA